MNILAINQPGPTLNKLLNLVFFQGLWFVAVIGAADNNSWYAIAGLAAFIATNCFLSATAKTDLLLVSIAVLTGLLVETTFLQMGLLIYNGNELLVNIAPIWILVLWAAFALALNGCLSWLQGRYVLAAILGAIGGPLSYFGGIKLGAAAAGVSTPALLLVIAAVYAIVTPLFLLASRRLS